jgi:uncharacterized protein (TIGR03790 family)
MASLRIKQALLAAACIAWVLPVAFALGPHEILLLANGGEPDSIEVAKAYARLRQIPDVNIVRLQLPAWKADQPPVMTPQDFTRLIWSPAVQAAKARGINDHILAWVYSTHFPIRIGSQPPVSLQGLTFMRNQMPSSKEIGDGSYVSPVFAGPDSPGGNSYGPQSFDSMRQLLREDMPLPCMALGYTGPRGNTKAEVLACLQTGVRSDATSPTGSVYFITNGDVRSRCRQWQFPAAVVGLRRMGVNASIGEAFPEGRRDVIGIMMGTHTVTPAKVGRFLPGCMAEHLTSAAAFFDSENQTKISRWIAAGATASAGTVWEPMSIWSKFPNARFFNHYTSGCTMIESFYQSIQCPLQIMLIGEPLAAPWAPDASLNIEGIADDDLVTAPRSIDIRVQTVPGISYRRFVYLVDGRIRGTGKSFMLDPTGLAPGMHEIRAVAYRTGFVRSQVFDVKRFRTE